MPKACIICHHSNSKIINADLAAGFSIPEVSLKHFGDYRMLDALRCHKRSHLPKEEKKAKNNKPDKKMSVKGLNKRARRPLQYRRRTHGSDSGTDQVLIAAEPVRIKGVVYPKGTEIPESIWNPHYLAVALRLGTVRRKAS